jgi:subtilisin-like proprotein convertase family protein
MLLGTPVEATGTGGTIVTGTGPSGGARVYQHNYFYVTVDNTKPIKTFTSISLNGVTHTSVQDLQIVLRAPDGTTLTVLSEADSDAADNRNFDGTYTFARSNDSKITLTNTKPGDSNTLNPGTYSWSTTDDTIFDGMNPNGQWRLDIADGWALDSGNLPSFTLSWRE